jgi:hypothetical protein
VPSSRGTCLWRSSSRAIRDGRPLEPGFYDSGAQIVTAESVDMGNGLPAIGFEEAMALAADPAATEAYYRPGSSR